jgi:type II secretion system protein I
MSRCRTRSRGFTFVEVLIALAVTSIGLLGLLRLHLLSTATADAAQATTGAVFVAQAQIAEVLAQGFPAQGTTSGAVERNGQTFTWTTEIRNAARSGGSAAMPTGLREVSTTVTWTLASHEKSMTMTTLVADTRIHERKTQ